MQKLNILLLTILFITSCQTGEIEKTVKIENKYSISIPSFLSKVSNLNEDASLQYQHAWKEFYVIVIDESKDEMQRALVDNNLAGSYTNDVDGYSKLLIDGFQQAVSVNTKSNIVDTTINNMPAKLLTISGQVEGIDAFYYLAFVEGKERYYQIMAWTLADKEYQYRDKMRKLIYTLKEL